MPPKPSDSQSCNNHGCVVSRRLAFGADNNATAYIYDVYGVLIWQGATRDFNIHDYYINIPSGRINLTVDYGVGGHPNYLYITIDGIAVTQTSGNGWAQGNGYFYPNYGGGDSNLGWGRWEFYIYL